MSEFDEYIRQGELGPKQKAEAWQTAIGLQDVDGLKPSPYLLDTAKRHIEGDITIDEVKGLINFQSIKPINSKGQIDTLNVTLEERAVLNCVLADAKITQKEIADQIRKSPRTIKRIMASLSEKQIIVRKNGKRDGWWEVLV